MAEVEEAIKTPAPSSLPIRLIDFEGMMEHAGMPDEHDEGIGKRQELRYDAVLQSRSQVRTRIQGADLDTARLLRRLGHVPVGFRDVVGPL